MNFYKLNAAGQQAVSQLLRKVVTEYYDLLVAILDKPENKALLDKINISDFKIHLVRNEDAYRINASTPMDDLSIIKLARKSDSNFSCVADTELYVRLYFATPNGSITDKSPAKKRVCAIDVGRDSGIPWPNLVKKSLSYSYIKTAGLATTCCEPETPAYGFQANLTLDLCLSAAEVELI